MLASLELTSTYTSAEIWNTTGSTYRRLNVPGEDDFIGAGVHFCATCGGPFYRDREVAVVGGGNSAGEESLFLTRFAKRVQLPVRGSAMKASALVVDKVTEHRGIELHLNTLVQRLEGDGVLSRVVVRRGESTSESDIPVDAVFVFIGLRPNTQWLPDAITRDEYEFVNTRQNLETSIPGVFAAGDMRKGSTKQAASAAGEGAAVALMVREYLKSRMPRYYKTTSPPKSCPDTIAGRERRARTAPLAIRFIFFSLADLDVSSPC